MATIGRKKTPGVPYIKREKGYPYYYVTYAPGKRKTLHRLNWEAAYGPIPKGRLLSFKDGNTLNCELSNLECVTRKDIADRNRRPETCYESIKRFFKTPQGREVARKRGEKLSKQWKDGTFDVEGRNKTLRERIDAGLIKPGMGTPADTHIAYWLAPKDPELRALILTHAPELIDIKRHQLNLRKAIKDHENAA